MTGNWIETGNDSSGGGSSGGSSGGYWEEVTTAQNVAETGGGLGVDGHGGDDNINDEEQIIFSFEGDLASAIVSFDSFSSHEHGSYKLYKDGQEVDSGSFSGSDGNQLRLPSNSYDGQFDKIVIEGEDCSSFHIDNLNYTAAGGSDAVYSEFPVNLSVAETDVDGSETLSAVTLSGLPDDAVLLVDGVEISVNNGTASIATGDLDNVTLRVPEGQSDFDLTAAVTSTDGNDTENDQIHDYS